MRTEFIIATHGELADGMAKALKFLTGQEEFENLHLVNAFTQDEFPELTIKSILSKISENSKIVVFTDLKQGSVNQIFCRLLDQYPIYLITGANLPLILELILRAEEDIDEQIILEAVETARSGIVYMNHQFDETDIGITDANEFLSGE